MPDYHFYLKDKKIVALNNTDEDESHQMLQRGYEKQFEEVTASTEKQALIRFADIRKNNRIDQQNFLAGAGEMPLIGVMTAIATYILRKKKP